MVESLHIPYIPISNPCSFPLTISERYWVALLPVLVVYHAAALWNVKQNQRAQCTLTHSLARTPSKLTMAYNLYTVHLYYITTIVERFIICICYGDSHNSHTPAESKSARRTPHAISELYVASSNPMRKYFNLSIFIMYWFEFNFYDSNGLVLSMKS